MCDLSPESLSHKGRRQDFRQTHADGDDEGQGTGLTSVEEEVRRACVCSGGDAAHYWRGSWVHHSHSHTAGKVRWPPRPRRPLAPRPPPGGAGTPPSPDPPQGRPPMMSHPPPPMTRLLGATSHCLRPTSGQREPPGRPPPALVHLEGVGHALDQDVTLSGPITSRHTWVIKHLEPITGRCRRDVTAR